jgi:hypothetical protein
MQPFSVIFGFIIPFAAGYFLISFFTRKDQSLRIGEKIVLAFPLGAGLLSYLGLYLGILGIKLAVIWLWVFLLPFIILFVLSLRERKKEPAERPQPCFPVNPGRVEKIFKVTIILLLLLKLGYVFYYNIHVPSYFDDGVSIWNYKSKVFYLRQGMVMDQEDPDFMGGRNPYYPNNPTFMKSWIAISAGQWEDYLVNWYPVVFFICNFFLLYYMLSGVLPPFFRLAFAYIGTSLPLWVFHAGTTHNDIVLGFYLSWTLIFLYKATTEDSTSYWYIASILAAITLFTKVEAQLYFLSGAIPLIVLYLVKKPRAMMRNRIKTIFSFLAVIGILFLPWFLLKYSFGVEQTIPIDYIEFKEVHLDGLQIMAREWFGNGCFNIFWLIFVAVLSLGIRRVIKDDIGKLVLVFLLIIGAIAFFHITTRQYEHLKIGTQFNRIMLHILPMAVFICGVTFGKLISPIQSNAARKENNG